MKNEEINLSDSFEILLKSLYGDSKYHQYAGFKTSTEWKYCIEKIIKSIELSLQNTIEISDKEHKNTLIKHCTDLREKISGTNDLNELNEKIILGLMNLVFSLIGDRPDHFELKKVNSTNHWKLNKNRQLMYYQSNEHKVNLIIEKAPQIGQFSDEKYNKNFLIRKLQFDFNGNFTTFLDWYKMEHFEHYNELF
jgi:hypothetical protein